MRPYPSAHATFGAALRAAIADSGLTLHAVRARLARRGVRVAVASLSYWQSGHNRPERPESLRAVAVMEDMFGLVPGALTGLLGPSRPRTVARVGGGRFAGLPSGQAVAAFADEIRRESAGVRILCTEEEAVLSAGRTLREIRTRLLGQVHGAGVDRWGVVSFAEPGQDLDAIGVTALEHCRLGRVRRYPTQRFVGTELLLDRALVPGDTFVIEYSVVVGQRCPEGEFFRAFAEPTGLYVARVRFAPSELPVRCYQFHAPLLEDSRDERELRLTAGRVALLATQDPGPGLHGIRWEWE
ncbi:hypothetical protein AB0M43_01495 [Longispora sp. NPDC051575]|uniref:hypothetical protein n=1 Tax=Longispora sp. NPDC051575 TaxID=3154943 RepID=UPI0034447F09